MYEDNREVVLVLFLARVVCLKHREEFICVNSLSIGVFVVQ